MNDMIIAEYHNINVFSRQQASYEINTLWREVIVTGLC